MMEKPDFIEEVTANLYRQVEIAKSMGLTYLEIQGIMLRIDLWLCPKIEAEFWLNKAEKER